MSYTDTIEAHGGIATYVYDVTDTADYCTAWASADGLDLLAIKGHHVLTVTDGNATLERATDADLSDTASAIDFLAERDERAAL